MTEVIGNEGAWNSLCLSEDGPIGYTAAFRPVDMTGSTHVRDATASDLDQMARVWHEAWHDAHAGIVPPELTRTRTWDNFRSRLPAMLPHARVAVSDGEVVGLCVLREDELHQLFVARHARGSGAAVTLIEDAERRLFERGFEIGWLACAIGNDRAARFYDRNGWRRVRATINLSETDEGTFPLEVWRYEKRLIGGPASS